MIPKGTNVEISMGTMFIEVNHPGRTDVITNVGRENYFYAAPIYSKDGFKILGYPGTTGPENVEEFLKEHLLPEEVIKAVEERYRRDQIPMSDKVKQYYSDSSILGSRTITF